MATLFETFVTTELPRRAAYLTIDNTGYEGDPNLAGTDVINSAPKGTWFLNNVDNTIWFKKVKTDATSWQQILVSEGVITFPANCQATDATGHAVYITGDKVGDYYQVTRVDPDDADVSKAIAVGIINAKSASDVCTVQTAGPITGLLSGLTPGAALFANLDATLREGPPSRPPTGSRVWQNVATATASNVFVVNIQRPLLVRP